MGEVRMHNQKLSNLTTTMIYFGTLLLSILSFFTTYFGMSILLDKPLALVGSLGLQIAMLGIAWNLMKIKENRGTYVAVFLAAAAFSITFSYANFDANLTATSRSEIARGKYADAAHITIAQYASMAKSASLAGRYQVERLNGLLTLEVEKGWATVMDEGSGDPFLQSVIDGARVTASSWKKTQGGDYRQGSGKGIISSYLSSRLLHAENNLSIVDKYITSLDSLSILLGSELPVTRQHELVNKAWATFPSGEIGLLSSESPSISPAPNAVAYSETPTTRQQTFKLVMDDLLAGEKMAVFAMLLAMAIDLIVILMAFVGSFSINEVDFLFDRVRQDTAKRIRNVNLDDSGAVSNLVDDSLSRFRYASKFGLDVARVIGDHHNRKKRFRITLRRESEEALLDNPETETNIDGSHRIDVLTVERQAIKNRLDHFTSTEVTEIAET